jgi:hypothetical protein
MLRVSRGLRRRTFLLTQRTEAESPAPLVGAIDWMRSVRNRCDVIGLATHSGDPMATTTAPLPAKARATTAYDRHFYSGMAVLMALTAFVGFAPTYYLRVLSGSAVTITGGSVTPLLHLHGVLFTGWVVFFILQTTLIARRKVAMHRTFGVAGVVLAAAMIVVGLRTAIASAARGTAPPGVDPLMFLAVPLFDMVLFAGFVASAIGMRANREAHKRLMLLAYISIITAAVARLPGILPYGPLMFFGLTFVFLALGVAYDMASRRRVHRVYVWGGALLVVSVPLRLAISATPAWRAFAEFLTR